MELIERFLNYVKIDTESDPNSETAPSTEKQFNLARVLEQELKDLGLETKVSDKCIVYGFLKANCDTNKEHLGFIAHMDTSPDMCGKDVKPRIIDYKGGEIILNEELNIKMNEEMFESLTRDRGHQLIVTDGTTLLGADDKAGVAEIMDMVERLVKDPSIKHGDISVAFTPDEEVGRGTENFDIPFFNADYAYTVDGGFADEVEYENFNAAAAIVKLNGISIHPGSSKNKMKNAVLYAMEFNNLLPVFDRPEFTEGYEGFNHLHDIKGDVSECVIEYIIRNHDDQLFEKQKNDFRLAADFINNKYGEGTCVLDIKEQYRNMRSIIETRMEIVDKLFEAMKKVGLNPKAAPIRGGTDGARLTYDGLLTPNIGTGGRNYHGKYEYANIDEMKQISDVLIELVKA